MKNILFHFRLYARQHGVKAAIFTLSVSVTALFFNNCSKGFSVIETDQSMAVNPNPNPSPLAPVNKDPSDPGKPPVNKDPSDPGKLKWVSLRSSGAYDPNCLNNSLYDACIFYKNPYVQSVITTGSGLNTALTKGADLSAIQTFGVVLKGRTSQDRLESSSLIVTLGDLVTTQQKPVEVSVSIGPKPKVAYKSDSQSVTALTHSYFWLQKMEEQLKLRTNIYYASGKKLEVFMVRGTPSSLALNPDLINNAYWSSVDAKTHATTNWISIGIANHSSSAAFYEEGLEAEVLLHEMGHANFAYAKGYPNYDPFVDYYAYESCLQATRTQTPKCTVQRRVCGKATDLTVPPSLGCQSAINEGLADFHYLMIFPDYPTIWETNYLSLEGLAIRNMKNVHSKTTKEFIQGQFCDILPANAVAGAPKCQSSEGYNGVVRDNAEIHNLGAAYASILFEIYSDAKTDKRAFEKTFLLHLQQIAPSTRFPETRDMLMAIDENNFASVNSQIIKRVFTAKGIN